jgi:hypothetical protein
MGSWKTHLASITDPVIADGDERGWDGEALTKRVDSWTGPVGKFSLSRAH